MVLYIPFPDRKFTNEKEAPKWTKTVFSPFVYMGFLLLHWFWWVFFMFLINFCLFCSFTLCPRENVTPVVIMVDVDVDVLHQNLLFFYTLCLNCSVYFMNLSFILFYDFFFLFAQQCRYYIIQLKILPYFFFFIENCTTVLKYTESVHSRHIYDWNPWYLPSVKMLIHNYLNLTNKFTISFRLFFLRWVVTFSL